MLSKNEIKYIQSLYHKKQRDEEQLFIAEGPKLAEELIKTSNVIHHLYATRKWLEQNATGSIPITEVTEIELARISNLQTPNQVVIIAKQQKPANEPVLKGNVTLLLDGIQDPGNMGTIIRIADWFGVAQLICSNDCVEVYNPKVVQSTMGSILRISCWYKQFEQWKISPNIEIYGALLHGKNVYSYPKVEEGLLIIGNESKGISEPLLSRITRPVTIPRRGGAESLNAAVAAGIIIGSLLNAKS